MDKLYVVTNNDAILIGVFDDRVRAEKVVDNIGRGMWGEKWVLEERDLNTIPMWLFEEAVDGVKIKVD